MNKGVKSMLCKISVLSAIDSLLILFSHEYYRNKHHYNTFLKKQILIYEVVLTRAIAKSNGTALLSRELCSGTVNKFKSRSRRPIFSYH